MRARTVVVGAAMIAALALVAYRRSGLLALPRLPAGITAAEAGLADLDAYRATDDVLRRRRPAPAGRPELDLALAGLAAIGAGDDAGGIGRLLAAVALAPTDLALGNAVRMALFARERRWLRAERRRGELTPEPPPSLAGEPLATFRRLAHERPGRETGLQLALALIDRMLLYPALESRAPASVEAVELLDGILAEPADRHYLPALYARGLNHLYRPAELVWPSRLPAPPDAASRDLALCVAVGRQVGDPTPALEAWLLLALGDAYAKEGRLSTARSWWSLGRNRVAGAGYRALIDRRLGWPDEAVGERLELALGEQLGRADPPLSDIGFVWRRDAPLPGAVEER